jgi:hypothetical protein
MAANQNHGEIWEDMVVWSITGMSKSEYDRTKHSGYTSKWDIDKPYDLISIKTTGSDGVGMGDIERFYNSLDPISQPEPWILSVAVYRQISDMYKEFQTVYEFVIDPKNHKDLFTKIPLEEISGFAEYVRSIPPGKQAQLANRKVWKDKRSKLYEAYGGKLLASIDAKIDGKEQRRTQSGLKISQLQETDISVTIYNTEYRGISLPLRIESPKRKRNK